MTQSIGRKNGRYAVKTGGKHTAPSVTAVIGILDKPALSWAAARETAVFAVEHQDEWRDLTPVDAIERLRKHHRGIWNRKADIGSLVHAVNEAWVCGSEFGPDDCDDFLPRADRGDADARQKVWDEAQPYVDGLANFWSDAKPDWVQVERGVVYDEPGLEYGGQFDILAVVHSTLWRLDIKTGRLESETGRPYPEASLQLTAYDRAKYLAVYDALGNLTDLEDNQRAERCGVLHVPGDGTWSIYPVSTGEREWELFLTARRLWEWGKHSASVVDDALDLPTPSRAVEGEAVIDEINRLQTGSTR